MDGENLRVGSGEFCLSSLHHVHTSPPLTMELCVSGRVLVYEIDSGACSSVLPYDVYVTHFGVVSRQLYIVLAKVLEP